MNLEEVYRIYQTLGLGGKNGTSEKFVPGDGPCPAKIMIIGEAPGAEEDKTGKPFQGPAGQVLNRFLGFAHLRREDVFVTNMFKYRPPHNRDPFPSETIASYPCIVDEIACVDPSVIILAGKIACGAFFPGRDISSLRGRGIQKGSRMLVCTYHPAMLLHNPRATFRAMIQGDFRLAADLSKTG